jgi:hypothetical protein
VRIANQLRVLGIFVAPSTVQNLLNRPTPPPTGEEEPVVGRRLSWRSIPAFCPNHVWSADVTRVLLWGLWPADVLVNIDHFSRKLMLVRPMVSLSSQTICVAFEEALRAVGPPKHLVTDRGFTSGAFADFLKGSPWGTQDGTDAPPRAVEPLPELLGGSSVLRESRDNPAVGLYSGWKVPVVDPRSPVLRSSDNYTWTFTDAI